MYCRRKGWHDPVVVPNKIVPVFPLMYIHDFYRIFCGENTTSSPQKQYHRKTRNKKLLFSRKGFLGG
jgi:hypothetical protein